MKIGKIIIGVISILIGIVTLIESYDVFRLAYSFGVNGFHIYAGFIVGFIFISLGILSLMMMNKQSKKYAETSISLSSVAIILCFRGPELFTDLQLFAVWGAICFIFALIAYFNVKKQGDDTVEPINHAISQISCPYCQAVINEGSVFCGSCGKKIQKQCPHCGALIMENSTFCGNCGKKVNEKSIVSGQTNNTCPHCGASINEGDVFCTECGKKIDEVQSENIDEKFVTKECPNSDKSVNEVIIEDVKKILPTEAKEEEIQYNYEYEEEPKTWRDYKFPIFGGLFIVLFLGLCWWYWDSSNKRVAREKEIAAREAFVKDSLRQDSIIKEKERQDSLEKARIRMLQEPYIKLLDKYGANEDHWQELYFLYDLNGDNYPEMWLQVKEGDEFHLLVYTNIEGEAKLLFRGNSGYNNEYYQGDNYILLNYAHMGSQVINKYYLENGVIKEENYFTLEAESLQEAVYKDIEEPLVSTYEITDKSPIYEIK